MAVSILTVASAALALSSLTDRSIWLDEAYTRAVAISPPDQFLSDLTFNGANMSLYLVFMRGWLLIADSDWWLRLPSVVFSTASVPALYLLGRRFVSAAGAVTAAGLLALSPPLLRHAQDARSYTLAVLLVIVSWTVALDIAESPTKSNRRWYIVAAAATFYAHIIGALFVAAQLLWLASTRRRDALGVATWIGVLVLPQLAMTLHPGANDPNWIPETTVEGLGITLRYLAGSETSVGAALVALAWLVGAFVAARKGDHIFLAPVVWVLVPLFGLLAVSVVSPMLVPRYLLMLVPGACLLVGVAWDGLPRIGPLLLGLVLAVSVPGLHAMLTRPVTDWREPTRHVVENARGDEAILLLRHSRHHMEHYWEQMGRPTPMPVPLTLPAEWGQISRLYGRDVPAAVAALDSAEGAWVVRPEGELRLGERLILAAIERRWSETSSREFDEGGIVVTYYAGNA